MKKYLYATTALIAAGALAGPAFAEDPVSLGVSGHHLFNAEYVDADDGVGEPSFGRRDHIFNRWGILTFSGNTTLDNGLQVGATFDVKTENVQFENGGGVEDGYVWMEFGGFRAQFGARNSAANVMHYQSPTPSMWGWGLESPVFAPVNGGGNGTLAYSSTYLTNTGDSEKITVFTPRVMGIQVGVSYTPELCQQAGGVTAGAAFTGCNGNFGLGIIGGPATDNVGTTAGQVWDIGANYVNSFDEVDLNISGGFTHGEPEVSSAVAGAVGSDDLEGFSAGLQVSYQGFTFGTAYREVNDGTFSSAGISSGGDRTNWSVGLRYATGPWGIGVQYVDMEVEAGMGAGEDEYNAFELGGTYDLGPGIQFVFGYQHHNLEDNLSGIGSENEVDAIFVGNAVFF